MRVAPLNNRQSAETQRAKPNETLPEIDRQQDPNLVTESFESIKSLERIDAESNDRNSNGKKPWGSIYSSTLTGS